jgi:hypothetical protein
MPSSIVRNFRAERSNSEKDFPFLPGGVPFALQGIADQVVHRVAASSAGLGYPSISARTNSSFVSSPECGDGGATLEMRL